MNHPDNDPAPAGHSDGAPHGRRFSKTKPIVSAVILVTIFAVLIVIALRPRQQREREMREALEQSQASPQVLATKAGLVPARGELLLPGAVQAITEAPIFARSEGYLQKRLADIGDRVSAGQLLAVVEAPEVDKQVQQGRAALARAEAGLAQAEAALQQSTAQMKLAEVTAQRWSALVTRRVVSRQEADEKAAAFEARKADNEAARANVAAASNAVEASRADLNRVQDIKGFQEIRAPFAGVITARNTDVGALIRSGSSEGRELYRLARISTVRVMINVPQMIVPAVRIGEDAVISVDERPGTRFKGKIVRWASALDPATRTLPVEIHVPNPQGLLLPGMYAQVRLANARSAPAVMVSGDTIVIRADGPQVAVVEEGGKVRFQKVTLGRDYGAEVEILSGLRGGETVVINPGDETQEGGTVRPRPAKGREPGRSPKQ